METEIVTKENCNANKYYSRFHLFSFSQFHTSFVIFRENNSVTCKEKIERLKLSLESREQIQKKRKWRKREKIYKENLI